MNRRIEIRLLPIDRPVTEDVAVLEEGAPEAPARGGGSETPPPASAQ